MLTPAEEAVIDKALHVVLKEQVSVTSQLYINVYNTVYSYCNKPTEEYYIEGEAIYELLNRRIHEYTSGLSFKASIKDLSDQAVHFQRASSILERLFSYIERFYIKASAYKGLNVERIEDLFYIHLYFNYIYKIEDNFIGLVFLELETMRKQSNQNCGNLRNVVLMYTEALRIAGQENKTERFYRMYIENYIEGTDFEMPISSLLRRTYLELYYARNVINDKGVAKEIVEKMGHRREEALRHVIGQVRNYRSCKVEYKVISVMEEEVRQRFKREYESFLKGEFKMCVGGFKDVYLLFCRIKKHMQSNCMLGNERMLCKIVKMDFVDKPEEKQKEILRGVVEMIGGEIERHNGSFEKEGRVTDELSEPVSSRMDIHEVLTESIKIDDSSKNLLDFYVIVQNEYAMEYYIASCQHRLLLGMNPGIEMDVYDMLVDLIGNGLLSRLKSIIMTYLKPRYLDRVDINRIIDERKRMLGLILNDIAGFSISSARISLLRHVGGFWRIKKQSLNLHPLLSAIKNVALSKEELKHRECINLNYTLSPVLCEISGTKYKMGVDLFSLILHVYSSRGRLEMGKLKEVAEDLNFDENIRKLVECGLLGVEKNDKADDSEGTVVILCRKRKESFIDLFEVPKVAVSGEQPVNLGAQKNNIVESVVCRFMKKHKSIKIAELCEKIMEEFSIGNDFIILPRDVESGIERLVEKGYLVRQDGSIEYVP